MRKITHIIVHESDSAWGDAQDINSWHLERGWSGIGYHEVILNGVPDYKVQYNQAVDGLVQAGRMIHKVGAHARGFNKQSIGICLIGRHGEFTKAQMASLENQVIKYMRLYEIPVENILGHYEIPLSGGKTCPEIEMNSFRDQIQKQIDMSQYGA